MEGSTSLADHRAQRDGGENDAQEQQEEPQGQQEAAFVIEGDGSITATVGGKAPTKSEIRLAGGAIPFDGQIKKGQMVRVTIIGTCDEVQFKDLKDKSGVVEATRRKQILVPTNAELEVVLSDEE